MEILHVQKWARMFQGLVDDGVLIQKGEWFKLATPEEQASLAKPQPELSRKPRGIGADWVPGPGVREWALAQPGITPSLYDAYLAFFVDYAASNGKTYKSWDAAFRNCVRGDWGQIRKNHKPGAVAAAMPGVNW
jgi:hypothetical protein